MCEGAGRRVEGLNAHAMQYNTRANKHGTREATQMSLFAALTYTLDYFAPLTIVLLHSTLHSSHPLKRSLLGPGDNCLP